MNKEERRIENEERTKNQEKEEGRGGKVKGEREVGSSPYCSATRSRPGFSTYFLRLCCGYDCGYDYGYGYGLRFCFAVSITVFDYGFDQGYDYDYGCDYGYDHDYGYGYDYDYEYDHDLWLRSFGPWFLKALPA